jgi:hypothetical protein
MLDDFDDDYPDECPGATCPDCGYRTDFDILIFGKVETFILPGK